MCMKNINVSTVFTTDVSFSQVGSIDLGRMVDDFTAVRGSVENEQFYVNGLTIFTFVSAISSAETDPELDKEYDIRWTFEPIIPNDNSKRNVLADTRLDVSRNRFKKDDGKICRHFSNQPFRIVLRDYPIRFVDCDYLLKVYLKEKEDETWEIQTINKIYIQSDNI